MAKKDFTVAIIGGGIAGAALGVGLANRGIRFHIYERQPAFEEYSAGLGIQSNGVKALAKLDPRLSPLLQKIIIRQDQLFGSYFEMFNGQSFPNGPSVKVPFDTGEGGMTLRSQLLSILTELLPPNVASFNKCFERLEDDKDPDGRLRMRFSDGTTAEADVVIGCDGLGSRVRRALVGEEHPSARARYTHRYCYRAMIPMHEAKAVLQAHGDDDSFLTKQTSLITENAYIIQFPVMGGQVLNLNAVFERPESEPWTDEHHTLVQATKDEVLNEFREAKWSPVICRLVECLHPQIGRWALFDLYENPPPSYSKGRICIVGDAAHATTPHLGIGASVSLCDAAVLADLLAFEQVQDNKGLETALVAYNEVRLAQGHELVQLSRKNGSALVFKDPNIGADLTKLRNQFLSWTEKVKSDDIEQGVVAGQALIGKYLSEHVESRTTQV